MSVAAIYTARNEADIIELSFRHMLAEGIDHIYTTCGESHDATLDILHVLAAETHQITIVEDHEPYYQQFKWINELAAMAGTDGHSWIVSSDVDEFWYAIDGRPIAEVLEGSPYEGVCAQMFRHHSWELCETMPKPLPKVAFRWGPNRVLNIGSHSVSGVGVHPDVLAIREWQYRSYEHFVRKAREASETLAPEARNMGAAWHHTRMDGWSDEEMSEEWDSLMAREVRVDPIPSRLSPGLVPAGTVL